MSQLTGYIFPFLNDDDYSADIEIEKTSEVTIIEKEIEQKTESEIEMSKSEFNVEKLSGSENYHDWCFAIENLLALKGLRKCIVEKEVAEGAPIAAEETDASKLEQAKSTLALSVEKNLFVHIRNCKRALEIWKKFRNLFEDRGLNRKICLLRTLISYKLEESDGMQGYIDGISNTASKLEGIGFNLTDEWLTAIMLAGLTEKFQPMIMTLESNSKTITPDEIKYKLLDSQTETGSGNESAFYGKKYKNQKANDNQKFNKKRAKKCWICKSHTHLANTCSEKKNSGKAESAKTAIEAAFTAFAAVERGSKNEWCIDSGASSHMTPYVDILEDKQPATNHTDIQSANDNAMKVLSYGKVTLKTLKNEIPIRKVLHVPDLAVNLLSVSKIVECGNSVSFNRDGCFIYDSEDNLLLNCKQTNGIYKVNASQNVCMLAKKTDNAMLWHRRLGHINFQSLKKMRDEAVHGIEFADDDTMIKRCEICAKGKQTRKSFGKSETNTSKLLELIHSDVCGPMQTKSINRSRYMLTFIDDFSRMVFVFFLEQKNQVLSKFKEFKAFVENQTGEKIKTLRTDNGKGEYCSNEFDDFYKKHGIKHELTTVYTPEQNGVSERYNRTIIEKAKCMMFDAELDFQYWAEATNYAVYVINRSVCAALKNTTPQEVWTGTKVSASNLKIFGSFVMVHIPKEKRRKLSPKSQKMIFVGIESNKKGFRCIDTVTKKVTVSRDVIFYESDKLPVIGVGIDEVRANENKSTVADDANCDTNSDETLVENLDQNETMESSETSGEFETPPNGEVTMAESIIDGSAIGEDTLYDDDTLCNDDTLDETKNDKDFKTRARIDPSLTPRKSTRAKVAFKPFQFSHFAYFTEPATAKEAQECDESSEWKTAMDEEMEAHKLNNTWTLVDRPSDSRTVKGKWVFKRKCDDKGKTIRFKARYVAKGYSQLHGIDYNDTFAPVVRHASIRFLFAVAVKLRMKIHQLDVVTAFLQGDLKETIFMEQPDSYHDGTKKVCRLNKPIYGLRQASRQWNIKLDTALKSFGLKRCRNDPCIYFSLTTNLIVAVYVDDFLIFYLHRDELLEIMKFMDESFKIKDLGSAKKCIGININQLKDAIEIDQCQYVEEILKRFNMDKCKPVRTPSDLNNKLTLKWWNESNDLTGKVPYQEAVGSLMYLALATRPDIAFAVGDVSRFNSKHCDGHWAAVKRIFRYLRGTANLKIRYKFNDISDFHASSDADWGSDLDKRRSCSGSVVSMSGAAIAWRSKRQPIVAQSSAESEYIALSYAVKEVMWLKQLARELNIGIDQQTVVFCDSKSAISLADEEAFRDRTKHIDIKFHYVRDMVKVGAITVQYVSTNIMTADSLTKAVTGEKTIICNTQMGLE